MRDIEVFLESTQRHVNGTVILTVGPKWFECTGVDSPEDLVRNPLGEYGETQSGWSADEAKGFIKLLETPLKVYYGRHPDEAL